MEQTTAYSATSSGGGEFDRRRFMLAVAGLVAAFIGLYGGFVFLRDSEAPKIITAIFAIIWGVAGIGALFFVANYAVESLPPKWTTRIQPYICWACGGASCLVSGRPHPPDICPQSLQRNWDDVCWSG